MGAVTNAAAALAIARPDLSSRARQIVLAIAYFESGFGTIPGAAFGFVDEDGPSNNWGARKGAGDAGCIMHGDADENGKVCFSRNSSAVVGAQSFFRTRAWGSEPYASKCIAAANAGDAWGVAAAMYEGGYYSGFGCPDANGHRHALPIPHTSEDDACRVRGYATAIYNTVRNTIAPSLGEAPGVFMRERAIGAPATSPLLVAGIFAAAVGLAWAFRDDLEGLVS
jgi:hypothetical protein